MITKLTQACLCTLDTTQVIVDSQSGYMIIVINTWCGKNYTKPIHPAVYFCEAIKCPIDEYLRRVTIMYKYFTANNKRRLKYQQLMDEIPSKYDHLQTMINYFQNDHGYLRIEFNEFSTLTFLECLNYFSKCSYKTAGIVVENNQVYCNQILYMFYIYHTNQIKFRSLLLIVLKNYKCCAQLCNFYVENKNTDDTYDLNNLL